MNFFKIINYLKRTIRMWESTSADQKETWKNRNKIYFPLLPFQIHVTGASYFHPIIGPNRGIWENHQENIPKIIDNFKICKNIKNRRKVQIRWNFLCAKSVKLSLMLFQKKFSHFLSHCATKGHDFPIYFKLCIWHICAPV